jgi:cytochrome c-type biogenesis protein CcmE
MRKTQIIGLLVIALSIGILVSVMGSSPGYADIKMATENPKKDFHVVGTWVKEKGINYDPKKDPNYFSFYLKDSLGLETKVVYYNNKPADFERSERVVVVGHMENSEFEAKQILMKCPSKYNDGTVEVKK